MTPALSPAIVATPTNTEIPATVTLAALQTSTVAATADSQAPLSGEANAVPANTADSGTVNSASVTVHQFTYDEESARVSYCFAITGLTDWKSLRAYSSWPTAPKLLIDQVPAPFLAGGSDYSNGNGCAYMQYRVGTHEIKQAQQVTFVIDSLRMDLPPGDPDVACQKVRLRLIAQYPAWILNAILAWQGLTLICSRQSV